MVFVNVVKANYDILKERCVGIYEEEKWKMKIKNGGRKKEREMNSLEEG